MYNKYWTICTINIELLVLTNTGKHYTLASEINYAQGQCSLDQKTERSLKNIIRWQVDKFLSKMQFLS